jgi:hypothetical protein
MFLKAEQLWRIASAYDTVAAELGVQFPQRAAFARKAKRFRTLARIAAKIEAAGAVKFAHGLAPRQETASAPDKIERRQVEHRTLAERLEMARAAAATTSSGTQKKDQPAERRLNHPFCIT